MDLASAGPLEVKFIITLRRSTPVIEYRRFELGPPGESKLPLSNRKYTDFLKILNNKNFYKFLINKQGKAVDWFASSTSPSSPKLISAIEKVLLEDD